MTKRVRTLLLLAPTVFVAGCEAITGPQQTDPSWARVPLDKRVTDAYTDFGFELFRKLRSEDPDGNVFVSPTSAAFALAMTANGAVGTTADEMALVLGIEHLDRTLVNETNRKWIDALTDTGDPAAELAIANSIWYRESSPMKESFRERVRTYYGAELAPISDAGRINGWVKEATKGRIETIVEGEVPGNVVAYLINALYFKADWSYPFEKERTRDGPFHLPDGSVVQLPMMSQERAFEVRGDAEVGMVRLPYGTGRFSMVLALPRPGVDLETFADRLDAEVWRTWMAEFEEVPRLAVQLPRFEVEWKSSLVEALHSMGMKVPFEAGLADFSEMFEDGGPWIDDVLQKTFLRVDEEGTQAAAVTSVVMVESAGPSLSFDRPFFLAIYDHATETILFLGQITDPRD